LKTVWQYDAIKRLIELIQNEFLNTRLQRHDLWKKKTTYAFSVSPHGNGLDCYRTWEDLVLGCIVIVKTSVLDNCQKLKLFAELCQTLKLFALV